MVEKEKISIIETLNNETKFALTRDYNSWRKCWVHREDISKTYLNFLDSTFSESYGWSEIDSFVKNYIKNHPEPSPLPEPLKDIQLHLYGIGASVIYEQMDPIVGRKKEHRLMEKEEGIWKIAGMQTIIYGFDPKE